MDFSGFSGIIKDFGDCNKGILRIFWDLIGFLRGLEGALKDSLGS